MQPARVAPHSAMQPARLRCKTALWRLLATLLLLCAALTAGEVVSRPFAGVTHIHQTETAPRPLNIHVVKIDLQTPGIRFKVTEPAGPRETIRQTTLDFVRQEKAQIAINLHFFLPFPSTDPHADLVGLAASNGRVYSSFEKPAQSYAIVADAPAINLDAHNRAAIVHADPSDPQRRRVLEPVKLWNAFAGSAQIVTQGKKTIPVYRDAAHPQGELEPGGPGDYSNARSWYALLNARTAIGLTQDNRTLVLFTVDKAGASEGMSVEEVAEMLIRDYAVYNALNMDGGGSSTLAIEDPETGQPRLLNVPSGGMQGRAVGSNLAVFAPPLRQATLPDPGKGRCTILSMNFKWLLLPLCAAGFLLQAEDKDGWMSMFDGKTLNGWKASERPENWKVEDGAIVGRGERSHLFWMVEQCENCEFRADIKLNKGGNSGMYFRAEFMPGWPRGYEAQVNNSAKDPVRTGSLYNIVKIYEQLVPDDTWWTQHIIADGNHIVIKVNGKTVVDYVDPKNTYTRGYLALQQHDPGSVVMYKNLMYKRLPKK